jgi:hypothetical protein
MLGLSKGGGRAPQAPVGGMGVPTQKVLSLSSQGMSEPEIVRTLREQGHTPLEVDRAMKDAMRSGTGAGTSPAPPQPPGVPSPATPAPPTPNVPPPMPEPAAPPTPSQYAGPPAPPQPQAPPQGKYTPTPWDEGDEMLDDDFDMGDFPPEKKLGPHALLSETEMGGQGRTGPGAEPIPFAEPPLPKGRDERAREVKERRRRDIEELVEEISEERSQNIMGRIQEVEERVEKLSTDVRNSAAQATGPASEEISSMKDGLSTLKQNVEETNARIDSLEEIVKESLTPMLNSVKKLKSMTGQGAPAGEPSPAPSAAPQPSAAPSATPQAEPSEPPRYAPKPEADDE